MNALLEIRVGHGPKTDFWGFLTLVGLFAVFVLFLMVAAFGFSLGDVFNTIVLVVVVGGGLASAALGYFLGAPQFVTLSREGIQVQSRVATYSVGWSRLTGIRRSVIVGMIGIEWEQERWSGSGRRFAFLVSGVQARAILMHPLCPRIPISPSTRRRLNLPAEVLQTS